MAAAMRDAPEDGGCVSTGGVMVPLVVALEGLAEGTRVVVSAGASEEVGSAAGSEVEGSAASVLVGSGVGLAVVAAAEVPLGGLMSTPADLHRPTAAASAFSWSATSQPLSMHEVAAAMKAVFEQEQAKSVRSQPVAPTFEVRHESW